MGERARPQTRRPPSQLRYAGLAAVVVLWVSVATAMYRAGLGFLGDRPISYLGTDPRSALVFRGGLIVAAGLMAGFSWYAFQRFSAPRSFLAASLIGLVGQVVAAVVLLSGPGSSHAVHTAGGLVLGASLPILMWRFAAASALGQRRRIAGCALFLLELVACAAGVALSISGRAPIAEIVPAFAFHLWVAVVTFWATSPAP
ncbi:MAG: hypothetical protein ACR2LJ_09300 [Acidimicrobiales bacterium]